MLHRQFSNGNTQTHAFLSLGDWAAQIKPNQSFAVFWYVARFMKKSKCKVKWIHMLLLLLLLFTFLLFEKLELKIDTNLWHACEKRSRTWLFGVRIKKQHIKLTIFQIIREWFCGMWMNKWMCELACGSRILHNLTDRLVFCFPNWILHAFSFLYSTAPHFPFYFRWFVVN